MKTLQTSDMNPMIPFPLTNVGIRFAMPVSTSEIWGINVLPSLSLNTNAVTWGAGSVSGTNPVQRCNAIWGTRGRSAAIHPMLAAASMHSSSRYRAKSAEMAG
jgi:hypothetical protein